MNPKQMKKVKNHVSDFFMRSIQIKNSHRKIRTQH